MLIAASFWTLTYALELLCTDQVTMLLLNKLQYLGISFLPLLMFSYAYHHVAGYRTLSRRLRAVLWGIPTATVVLAFTNEFHGLVWPDTFLDTSGTLVLLVNEPARGTTSSWCTLTSSP